MITFHHDISVIFEHLTNYQQKFLISSIKLQFSIQNLEELWDIGFDSRQVNQPLFLWIYAVSIVKSGNLIYQAGCEQVGDDMVQICALMNKW